MCWSIVCVSVLVRGVTSDRLIRLWLWKRVAPNEAIFGWKYHQMHECFLYIVGGHFVGFVYIVSVGKPQFYYASTLATPKAASMRFARCAHVLFKMAYIRNSLKEFPLSPYVHLAIHWLDVVGFVKIKVTFSLCSLHWKTRKYRATRLVCGIPPQNYLVFNVWFWLCLSSFLTYANHFWTTKTHLLVTFRDEGKHGKANICLHCLCHFHDRF